MSVLNDFCIWCHGPYKIEYDRHIQYTVQMIKDPMLVVRRSWRDLDDAIHNYVEHRLYVSWLNRSNSHGNLSENELITAKRLFKDYATKLAAK